MPPIGQHAVLNIRPFQKGGIYKRYSPAKKKKQEYVASRFKVGFECEVKVLDPLDPDTDPGTWKWTSTMADNGPMYIRRSTTIDMAQDMT